VSLAGFRQRATGALEWLQKGHCEKHGGFTIYPSGQVPYGRESVAPVEPGGQAVIAGGESESLVWSDGFLPGSAGCRGRPAVGA